ncbi:terminal uridylyltransferase Tailor-like isoform X2 [Drosophila ficusphila]|uniref:terminal uridylyltransferase Tailor-like isoform X2 n=1 Tax=Drosophila ficusphila TaxID=30025 RepID=UPI0007E8627F|nr:terminal uridylyltransferase Tailor-like isoform X2 [Drosophila ficusphila]
MYNFWNALEDDVRKAVSRQNNVSLFTNIKLELMETLRPEFSSKSIHIHTFGSRVMGVAGPDSDLDLYVDIGNCSGIYSDTPTKEVLQQGEVIKKAIQKAASKWDFLGISGGRCPVIVVRHRNSNIQCDISFSNSMTLGQNQLVNYIFELQPIARYMVVYLRGWAKKQDIWSDFRSHLLVLMVIFVLQRQGQLPTINQLQHALQPDVGRLLQRG